MLSIKYVQIIVWRLVSKLHCVLKIGDVDRLRRRASDCEVTAAADDRSAFSMIDCAAFDSAIRGASWQLKMRSLGFVCHFDLDHQARH